MRDRGLRGGGHGRRQRCGEDEPAGEGANEIAHRRRAGHIAAHTAIGLAKRAFDQGNTVCKIQFLGHTAAAWPVKADGMDLIKIGHCAVFFGHLDNLLHRADVAVHGIDRFKGHDLGRIGRQRGQLPIQVFRVIMPPDHLFGARVANAFDHRGVVELITQDHRIGQAAAKRRKRRPVGHIARGEQKRIFLAVQIGQLFFKRHVMARGPRDIARPACAGSAAINCILHGLTHHRVLPHAQIIV